MIVAAVKVDRKSDSYFELWLLKERAVQKRDHVLEREGGARLGSQSSVRNHHCY